MSESFELYLATLREVVDEVRTLSRKVDNLQRLFDDLYRKIDQLSQVVDNLSRMFRDVNDMIRELSRSITSLERLGLIIINYRDQFDNISKQISSSSTSLSSIINDIKDIKTTIIENVNYSVHTLTKLLSRVDEVYGLINDLKLDISVNLKRISEDLEVLKQEIKLVK